MAICSALVFICTSRVKSVHGLESEVNFRTHMPRNLMSCFQQLPWRNPLRNGSRVDVTIVH